MKFTRRRFGIAASAMLATGVTPALAQGRPKIRVGVLRLASSGNVFIAADRNYFKDAGFDVDTNAVTLVSQDGEESISLQSKDRVAAAILDRVERLLRARTSATALR